MPGRRIRATVASEVDVDILRTPTVPRKSVAERCQMFEERKVYPHYEVHNRELYVGSHYSKASP